MSRFLFDENVFYQRLNDLLDQEKIKYGSWETLAGELKVNKDTLLKWRNRERFPNLRDFIKLCEISNSPPETLLFPKK